MDADPPPRECPGSQGLRDALPLGQMDWQHAPLDPALGHIQDGSEHGSPPQGARAATACGGGDHLCDPLPFLGGPVAWIWVCIPSAVPIKVFGHVVYSW